MDMVLVFGIERGNARFLQVLEFFSFLFYSTFCRIFSRRRGFVILEIKFSTHQSRPATPAISLVLSGNSIFAGSFSPPFVFDSLPLPGSTLWFRGSKKNFVQDFRESLVLILSFRREL